MPKLCYNVPMKLDRLMGILTILLQSEKATAPELAAKFEVSRRTILRDIDTLCAAGIPVVTQQGTGGGIAIAEGFRLDKSVLTTDELTGMIAGLKGIGSVSAQLQIERTLDKLGANSQAVVSLREPVVIDLASHYKSQLTEKIELIKRAVLAGRLIEFDYYYEKGEARRRIEPCYVIFQWSSWYVFGWCTQRQDWRMFKLTRLWDLQLCDEQFAPRAIPPERQDHNAHFTDDIRLVALFDTRVKYQLIETYGLGCYTETPEGLHFECGFTNRDYLLSWLLGFGGHVKVLVPEDLAQDIKTAAENILRRYDET